MGLTVCHKLFESCNSVGLFGLLVDRVDELNFFAWWVSVTDLIYFYIIEMGTGCGIFFLRIASRIDKLLKVFKGFKR